MTLSTGYRVWHACVLVTWMLLMTSSLVFAQAASKKILCLAHVTNTMGQTEQDFEKGEADGTADVMRILEAIVQTREP